MNRQAAGMLGEWRAALYLLRRGMRILKWRYRAGHHEIDLIAQDGNTLVFVEVKARPSGRRPNPRLSSPTTLLPWVRPVLPQQRPLQRLRLMPCLKCR